MFRFARVLMQSFAHRVYQGGMGANVKRPYRIEKRLLSDARNRVRGRRVNARRMMKS